MASDENQRLAETEFVKKVRETRDYQSFVGPKDLYDIIGAMQFNLLTFLGLRADHYLLDIGCGSLRAGRLFIPYLLPGHYYGLEPEKWVVDEAIKNEIGEEAARMRQPVFSHDDNYTLSTFDHQFDFLLAQSVFSHAPESHIRRCLSEAIKVMGKESCFAANFIVGDENYTGSEFLFPGLSTYTVEHMQDLATEQDLALRLIDWPHPGPHQWMAIADPAHLESFPNTCDFSKWYANRMLRSRMPHVKRWPGED